MSLVNNIIKQVIYKLYQDYGEFRVSGFVLQLRQYIEILKKLRFLVIRFKGILVVRFNGERESYNWFGEQVLGMFFMLMYIV